MTQQDLADHANISRSAVKYVESGSGSTLSTFIGIIRALELDATVDQIFAAVPTISPIAIYRAANRSTTK